MKQTKLDDILTAKQTPYELQELTQRLGDIERKVDHLIESLHEFRFRAREICPQEGNLYDRKQPRRTRN